MSKEALDFEALAKLVDAVRSDERRQSVRFGCDCGCGGDSYTGEEWDEMCDQADEARAKLVAFGVTFSPES